MKTNGKYYNQLGGGNVAGKTGLINLSVEDLTKVLSDAVEAGSNQVTISFNLWKTSNGRYVKGTDNAVDFPENCKPGSVSATHRKYERD
jgi:hypothetical protein